MPREVRATYPTVTFEVDRDRQDVANGQASDYCAQYGRAAHQRSIEERGDHKLITYECV